MGNDFFVDHLCMFCMTEKNYDGICQNCDFDENKYQPSPHHLPLRTILNGKYLIGRVLGEGGFGITYLGWDLNLDLKIAVKEYYPMGFVTRENTTTNTVTPFTGEKIVFFQSGREKFVDEAKRLAKFYSLPGIVSIKDFFLENSTAYIVMEYVDGETFKQYLTRMGGKIPAALMFDMMRPVMNSLIEIHKVGIIHRDISPDNIMITKEGNIKLLDFGSARDFVNSGNKSLSIMLKPGYAPEEQYRSKGIQGPWTDVYSLCATMYKAMTGVTPDESSERIHQDQLKKPSELGIDITVHQEAALMKGLAVLQEKRYQSISELSNTLFSPTYQKRMNPVPSLNIIMPDQSNIIMKSEEKYKMEMNSNIEPIINNTSKMISETEKAEHTPRRNIMKWIVTLGILITIVIAFFVGYLKLKSNFDNLQSDYDYLQSKNNDFQILNSDSQNVNNDSQDINDDNDLQIVSNGLQDGNNALQSEYDDLQSKNNNLQSNYDDMQSSYNSLQSDNDDLQSNYNSLQSDYDNLQSNYNSLQSDYDNLKSGFDDQEALIERVSEVMPILIENIRITNESEDGYLISEGTEFNSKDVRYINCYYDTVMISNNNTNTGDIMVKVITPYGDLITFDDGTSPGFSYAMALDDGYFGLGSKDGDCTLNSEFGWYLIEFWYNDIKIKEDYFNIYEG